PAITPRPGSSSPRDAGQGAAPRKEIPRPRIPMLHCSIISRRPDPGPEDALMNRGLGETIATLQRLRKPEAPAAGRRSQRSRPVDWRRRFKRGRKVWWNSREVGAFRYHTAPGWTRSISKDNL